MSLFDAVVQTHSLLKRDIEGMSDMPRIMLNLGGFEFSVDTAAYNALTRDASWRWAEQQRIGKQDLLQYTGKSGRTIKLDGEVHASTEAGVIYIDVLLATADVPEPKLLVTSSGDVLGYWVIKNFTDTTSSFLPGGEARHKTYSITIQHYGDDLSDP